MKADPPTALAAGREMDPRFSETVFVVEATSFERMMLWAENDRRKRVRWEADGHGWLLQVGELGGMPVSVSFVWARLNGYRVVFCEATSQVVDHRQVEAWLEANCNPRWDGGTRRAHCDAMNFHHCLSHIRELGQQGDVAALAGAGGGGEQDHG